MGLLRLFGRHGIGCLERSDQGIRVLRSTSIRHIPATQRIHEFPRPRAYGFIGFILPVAVTITNKLAPFQPAHVHGATQRAAG